MTAEFKKTYRIMGILTLIFVLITTITSCDYRTPSRVRFSKSCDIEIPKDVVVTKDEYQDMWQDYAIVYDLELTQQNCTELTMSIRNSAYYNPDVFVTDYVDKRMFVDSLGKRAVWARTETGYIFQTELGRDLFSATIDTLKMTAHFYEAHD